jgi:hypothetical protein
MTKSLLNEPFTLVIINKLKKQYHITEKEATIDDDFAQ